MSSEWNESVDRFLLALEAQTTHLHRAFEGLADRVARLELHDEIRTMTDWIDHAVLASEPLVSVVMPTRDRRAFLERSIGSLIAQRYERWEAVVVDDGSTDGTVERLAAFDEPRIRVVRADGVGAGGARNVGLDNVRGDLVAYMDDDNRMHPLWLKAVVWAFEQRPDVDCVYGAIVIDDTARLHNEPGARLPSLWMHRFDRRKLEQTNLADMGAIAHRASVGARFDPTLGHGADWEFLLQLTAGRDALALPVVAVHYRTDAPHRLSDLPTMEADFAAIRQRHADR